MVEQRYEVIGAQKGQAFWTSEIRGDSFITTYGDTTIKKEGFVIESPLPFSVVVIKTVHGEFKKVLDFKTVMHNAKPYFD